MIYGRLGVQIESFLTGTTLAEAKSSVFDHEHIACTECIKIVSYHESLANVAGVAVKEHNSGLRESQVVYLFDEIRVQFDLIAGDQVDHFIGQVEYCGQLDVVSGLGWLVGHKDHEILIVVEYAEHASRYKKQQPNTLIERVE